MYQVEGRRGGDWIAVPDERYPRIERAQHRMGVYARLIEDAEWRLVKIRKDEDPAS